MNKINVLNKLQPAIQKVKFQKLRRINRVTILAALSYLSVLVVFPLIFSKKNTFINYHAKQGVALLAVWVLGFFSFYFPILPVLFAIFIAASILFGIVNVFLNHERPLPLVGKLAYRL